MILESTRRSMYFIMAFAVCNVVLSLYFYHVAQDVKSEYPTIEPYNVFDLVLIIFFIYVMFTLILLMLDLLGRKLRKGGKNIGTYILKSAFILAVIFYDGVLLFYSVPAFFDEMSGRGSPLWQSIVLSMVTPSFGLLFCWKPLRPKIEYDDST